MATFTVEYPERKVVVAKWAGLVNGEAGVANGSARFKDRSVQVFGTFGASGNVVIEGSDDGTNWETLRDSNETPLSLNGPGKHVILEPSRYIRPRVTAGDGSTNLTVIVMGVSF